MSKRCECAKCRPPEGPVCTRVYKHQLNNEEKLRYQSPRFWCQCGAWKYDDAMSCDDCWREGEGYGDR